METRLSMFKNWRCYSFTLLMSLLLTNFAFSSQSDSTFSWTETSIGLSQTNIKSIQGNKFQPEYVLCLSEDTIYLSSNYGESWKSVFTISTRKTVIEPVLEEALNVEDEDEEEVDLDWDESDLRREGILQDDESMDDIDESELRDRLKEAGLLESSSVEIEEREEFPEKIGKEPGFLKVVWDPTKSEYAYAVTQDSVYRSTDQGMTWTKSWSNLNDPSGKIRLIAVSSPGGIIVLGLDKSVYYSINKGETFSPLTIFTTNTEIMDLKADPFSHDGFFVATIDSIFFVQLPEKISIYAKTPSSVSEPIRKIAVAEGAHIIVSTFSALYSLQSNGYWEQITPLDIRSALIYEIVCSDDLIWTATNRGVFVADVKGLAGQFRNNGLWELNIFELDVFMRNQQKNVWAATKSGVFLYQKATKIPEEIHEFLIPERSVTVPGYAELTAAALHYAELDDIRTRTLINSSSRSVWMPLVQFDFRASYDDDTSYDRSRSISTTENYVVIGLDDQSLRTIESENYRFQLRLQWYPKIRSNRDQLTVRKQLRRDLIRRQELLTELCRLYNELSEKAIQMRYQQSNVLKSTIEVDFLKARLDCLTGFYLSDNSTIKE
jgi:hypothetical protein